MRSVEPSFLLHPLDFVGAGEAPGLSFFPGMNLSLEHKLGVLDGAIGALACGHAIVTIEDHAQASLTKGGLVLLEPPRATLDGAARSVAAQRTVL
jgi:hypothetical protein